MSKKERLIITLLLFAGALISSYFALQTLIKYEIQNKVNHALDKFPGSVSYKRINYSLIKNEITIDDLKFSYQNYSAEIGKIKIDLPFSISKIPPSLSVSIADATLSSNLPYMKEMLSLTDYHRNKVKINAATIYLISGNNVNLSLSAEGKDLGSINLGVQLQGNLSAPSRLKLKKLELTYRDQGLVKGFLRKQAELAGEDVRTFKKQLISSLQGKLPPSVLIPLSNFIEAPSCLHLSLNPKRPITLHEAANIFRRNAPIEEISSKLNITLSICD